MGAAQSILDDQAQFRVRFTRSRGFAALFERPENSYQWSGYGTLQVEPRGIQFRATRRVIGLPRAEARFVAGREISNVYREGDGVRVEFRDDTRQNVLNFWAEDSAAAASIVEQLPTVHTVEVDDLPRGAARSAKRAFRVDLLVIAAAALVLIVVGTWGAVHWINRPAASNARAASSTPEPVAVSLPAALETPRAVESSVPAIPAPELILMKADYARFIDRSETLRIQFDSALRALLDGNMSQEDFADGLERWLIPQWASTEQALRATQYPAGTPREHLRSSLLAVTSNWQIALEVYANGLRAHDSSLVRSAFRYMRSAERAQDEAWRLVRRQSR